MPTDLFSRTTKQYFWARLWLLRAQYILLSRLGERGDGDGNDAGHRYPATFLQLRRVITMGIHTVAIHIPAH